MTNSITHVCAKEALRNLTLHCEHDNGGRSYRLTPAVGASVITYIYAKDAEELRRLAVALLVKANDWSEA